MSAKKKVERKETKKEHINQEEGKENKKREREQNKILKIIFFIIGAIVLGFLVWIIASNLISNFNYRGVDFTIVKFCDSGPPCLITYQTSLPVVYQGQNTKYNFYLRNDPRQLEKDVVFDGNITLAPMYAINITGDLTCNGYGSIAVANLASLYSVLGIEQDQNLSSGCDPFGRYMTINIKPGNETVVRKFGPVCYDVEIKGCEILQGTERLMTETFVKINEALKNQSKS